MFFIIPIGHEELTLRGLPFATIGLMVALLAAFLTIGRSLADSEEGAAATKATPQRSALDIALENEAQDQGIALPQARRESTDGGASPREISRPSLARRFGFVPSHPGIGLVTYMFLHAGWVSLVISLVFLWSVAAKLEALWSKPVFLGCFLASGVAAALVHGALTSTPEAPLLGASGAIAGLMGASLVRLGQSKVYYAYFVWFGLKPKVGTFDAPAYITPILWLVTQLGVLLASMGLAATIGDVSFTAWFGGIAFGCATAFALRALRFEERVLHRAPEVVVAPEEMPLVAFARRTDTAAPLGPKLAPVAASIERLDRGSFGFVDLAGAAFDIRTVDVRVWTIGQISRAGAEAEEVLPGSHFRPQAVLLGLLVAAPEDGLEARKAIVVDAARIRYAALLDEPVATPKDAFFKLVSKLNVLLPGAAFAGDRAKLRSGDLPQFATLPHFFSRLGDAAILTKGR
jgi:membrane associated rhomboid family serine protease